MSEANQEAKTFAGIVQSKPGLPSVRLHGEVHGLHALASSHGLPSDVPPHELLSRLWQSHGTSALAAIDGAFALCVCDLEGTHLFRSHSGLRDVFWLERGGLPEAYASSIGDLPGRDARPIDRRGLLEYLRLLDIAAPATLFKDIHAVEPGQVVSLLPGQPARRLQIRNLTAVVPSAFATAVDTLDRYLGEAIASRFVDAERPAAFLSGGIDSALLCSIAARIRPDTVAITVGFDGEADESHAAAAIAKHLGLRHEVMRFDRAAVVRAFERLAAAADQPLADPTTPVTLLALEAARARFDIVLDGTGADEAVGLMPPRHVRVAVEWGSRVPPAWRRVLVRALRGSRVLDGYAPLLDFEHPAEMQLRWHGFDRHQVAELLGVPPGTVDFRHTRLYRSFETFSPRAHFERSSAVNDVMPCERLTQAMLASGLAMRFPFTALAVDGFLRQLRTEWRCQPGQPKRILRELLARYVPRELWDRPKHGFDFPLASFLAGENAALVRRYVLAPTWARHAGMHPEAVSAWGHRFIGGDQRAAFKAWALVVLGAWLEAHTQA